MSTLAERLTRTGEAILDLAAALPDDLRVVSIHSDGYDYTDRTDAAMHLALFRDALRTVADLGGVWVHTLSPHEPGANAVHHQWRGTFHGWAVQITAIWMASELPPVVPMVEQLPPPRTWTTPSPAPCGTGTTYTVKRACNGCGRILGDVTAHEMDTAIAGLPAPDVREECGCAGLPRRPDHRPTAEETAWWRHEHATHPEVDPARAVAAIDAVHWLELAGAW